MAKDDFKKEKAKKIKEQKAETKPQEGEPAKEKEQPKKESKNDGVAKKVQAMLSRHKNLPQDLVESLMQSKSGMECKRRLRDYLRANATKEAK